MARRYLKLLKALLSRGGDHPKPSPIFQNRAPGPGRRVRALKGAYNPVNPRGNGTQAVSNPESASSANESSWCGVGMKIRKRSVFTSLAGHLPSQLLDWFEAFARRTPLPLKAGAVDGVPRCSFHALPERLDVADIKDVPRFRIPLLHWG